MSNIAEITTVALTSVGSAASLAVPFISGINSKMAAAGEATYYRVIKSVVVSSVLLFIGGLITLAQIILMPGNLPYWAWLTGVSLCAGMLSLAINCPEALDRVAKHRQDSEDSNVRELYSARSAQTN